MGLTRRVVFLCAGAAIAALAPVRSCEAQAPAAFSVQLDLPTSQLLDVLQRNLRYEHALCLTGKVSDGRVRIQGVVPAWILPREDSLGVEHVRERDRVTYRCPNRRDVIGTWHNHPNDHYCPPASSVDLNTLDRSAWKMTVVSCTPADSEYTLLMIHMKGHRQPLFFPLTNDLLFPGSAR